MDWLTSLTGGGGKDYSSHIANTTPSQAIQETSGITFGGINFGATNNTLLIAGAVAIVGLLIWKKFK
jgi:hypothetical protein